MLNYKKLTKHPEFGTWEKADWIDNHFGKHNYGVIFPSHPNHVVDPREDILETKDDYPLNTFHGETRREVIEYGDMRVKEAIEKVMNKGEQCHGFQPRGYATEEQEKEIYFDGFENGRAMMRIDLLGLIKKI
jgi:hypothetical protein